MSSRCPEGYNSTNVTGRRANLPVTNTAVQHYVISNVTTALLGKLAMVALVWERQAMSKGNGLLDRVNWEYYQWVKDLIAIGGVLIVLRHPR